MGSGASTTVKKPDTFKFHSGVEGGNVEENLAALHVQSWCRKKISKRKSKRKVNWKIYSEIEYQDECLGMKMHKMFCNLKVLQECLERNSGLPEDTVTDGAMQHEDGGDGLKSIRAGPFGIDPNDFDHDDVVRAIEKFQSGEQIGLNILRSIVVRGYKLNSRFPNVRHLNITKTGCCVVVGDIHGQLEDLLMIFEKAGLPSDSNPYVFNGDFVDRGDNGVEVMAIYLMFQILYPDSVFINRGNHEDFLINKQFGFENEVFKKYNKDILGKKSDVEDVTTPIGNDKKGDKICVLHGGLSKQVTIKRLENVDRMKFSSIMHTALVLNGSEKLSSGETINYDQATTIVGCTWSDPQNQDGLKFNVKRGCGVFFGPDITAKFLKDHKLNLLIRSHECLEDGYRLSHNDKLCTVFSASDYYGPESNLGAYIRVDANLKPHYFTFAGYLERKNLPSRSAVDYAAMENVHAVIVKKKKQLLNAFKSADKGNTKRLSVHEWCNCMEQVTELFLPWRSLLPVLTRKDKDGMVIYKATVNKMSLNSKRIRRSSVADSLYKNLDALQYIFRLMDTDGSGTVGTDEFVNAILLMSKHVHGTKMTKADAEEMANAIDLDHNGEIDFNEFAESFRLIENQLDEDTVMKRLSLAPTIAEKNKEEENENEEEEKQSVEKE